MEDKDTRLVWICMMAMADKHGRVYGSIPGIANRARVDLAECESALNKFLAPDAYSRTKDHEGRRIQVIEGGWRLINHGYYRNLQDTESQKAYKAAWAREKRKRDRDAKGLGVDVNEDKNSNSRQESTEVDDIAKASPYATPSPQAKKTGDMSKRAKSPFAKDPDEEFFKTLKASPAYIGVDIDREIHKIDLWLLTPKGKGRKKTCQFILNWMNRVDRIVQTNGRAPNIHRALPPQETK